MLGGTGVIVSGSHFLISEDDDIQCIFDGIEVRGVYIDERKVLCICPLRSQAGRLLFQISVNGSTSFLGESIFTSCKSCSLCNSLRSVLPYCFDLFGYY